MNKQEQIAYEKGIAQGRVDCKEELKALKVYFDNCLYYHEKTDKEKQAYAKGRDENKDKYFNAGIQKGQSDLKARLILIIQKDHDLCESCYIDLEEALAEATKGEKVEK